jgi:hypothetical protein
MSVLAPVRRPLRDTPGRPGGQLSQPAGQPLACPGRRRIAVLPVAAGVLILAAGCSAGPATVTLPRKSSPASAVKAAALPRLTPRQQVIAAYTGYTQALPEAEASQSAARVRAMMSPYLSASAVTALLRAFRAAWRKHEISYGSPVTHIMRVTITGNRAVVDDCANDSHSGLENARTGQPIAASLGASRVNLVTRLVRVHARWLIGFQNVLLVPCSP